jgi:hypothetical protein
MVQAAQAQMTNNGASPVEIQRTLRVLFPQGGLREVRIPKAGREGTISGYFNDWQALTKAVAGLNAQYPGIYVTLNDINPDLLARSVNRLKPWAKETTGDRDITGRLWALIDCDPVRPAGLSSSQAEHETALERARDIAFALREEGFPEPVLADSGNGGHLLFAVALPNDDATTAMLENFLKALAKRFDDDRVKIDTAVGNAARITKLYGTMTRKGDSVPERPHRLSRILSVPAVPEVVPRELLEELARTVEQPVNSGGQRSKFAFSVEKWVADVRLEARGPERWKGGRKWVLPECPFNPDHKDPDAAIFETADGVPGFTCLHSSCSGYTWKDFRERTEGPRPQKKPPQKQSTGTRGFTPVVRDAAEIYDADFPVPVPIVAPILYPGLTLMAGRAKVGKSWLALDLALSIVQGGTFAGHLKVTRQAEGLPGDVLYVSLEERPRQTRARLRHLTPQDDSLRKIKFIHELPALMSGGAAALDAELAAHPARVVIVDSLLGITKLGRKSADALQHDYIIVNTLRDVAERHGVALVLIAHTRKAGGDYFVDLIQGTTGTTAAADAIWVVEKKADGTGVLHVTGREVEDKVFGLRHEGALWHIIGEGEEYTQTEERQEIIDLLKENGPMKPMAIARALQKRVPGIQSLLCRLRDKGQLTRRKYGEYAVPGDNP